MSGNLAQVHASRWSQWPCRRSHIKQSFQYPDEGGVLCYHLAFDAAMIGEDGQTVSTDGRTSQLMRKLTEVTRLSSWWSWSLSPDPDLMLLLVSCRVALTADTCWSSRMCTSCIRQAAAWQAWHNILPNNRGTRHTWVIQACLHWHVYTLDLDDWQYSAERQSNQNGVQAKGCPYKWNAHLCGMSVAMVVSPVQDENGMTPCINIVLIYYKGLDEGPFLLKSTKKQDKMPDLAQWRPTPTTHVQRTNAGHFILLVRWVKLTVPQHKSGHMRGRPYPSWKPQNKFMSLPKSLKRQNNWQKWGHLIPDVR